MYAFTAVSGAQKGLKGHRRDHPKQYRADNPSLFDLHEDELHSDPIPAQDLKLEKHEEQDKEVTKHCSSSDKKYHTGF
ncbi:hypothetical protein [Paenibacillus sp. URB8-2]|uniref:hypothetical protein n=1 Tax=Paenibacillus sp. URB8-2 TaxID=2741301 RepID=UPI0015B948E9|nr:hypothetical protein [Paenibacillus sp. URB8-2]BCG56930.1 hypothetical protein PUR_03550 [Paenibacillus sp. URB8-2]